MNKQQLKDVINSKSSEQEIIEILSGLYKNNPDVFEEKFILNRSIFHLLCINGKIQVIAYLLENLPLKHIAYQTDKTMSTLWHYAVKHSESIKLISILEKYIPEQINKQNKWGNTPLHEAIISEKSKEIIKKLFELKNININIKNNEGKTVFELALTNSDLQAILISLMLIPIDLLNLHVRSPLEASSKTIISQKFPRLSEHALLKSKSLSKSNLNDITLFKRGNDDEVLEDYGLYEYMDILLKAYKTNKDLKLYNNIKFSFCSACLTRNWGKDDKLSFQLELPETKEILNDIIKTLYIQVERAYQTLINENSKLHADFIILLLQNKITEESNIKIPDFDKLLNANCFSQANDQKKKNLGQLESIWLLVSCKNDLKETRTFSFLEISNKALGLLLNSSVKEILIVIRILYPYLNIRQKLIANFVVWEIINFTFVDTKNYDSSIDIQLKFLNKLNESHLGQVGMKINAFIKSFTESLRIFNEQILLKNLQLIEQLINNREQKFDKLVEQAIKVGPTDRTHLVQLIASELRTVTLTTFVEISVHEFLRNKQKKDDSSIVKSTDIFNKLSNFFSAMILSQPPANIANSIGFMLELAYEVGRLHDQSYPDLNSVMMISSVLNNNNISRLDNNFEKLSPWVKSLYDEITCLVDRDKNSRWMREVYQTFETTLPFLGLYLTDVTFAKDGNSNPLARAEALGVIMRKLLQTKIRVNYKFKAFSTNLPEFISNYMACNEEVFYIKSLKIKPRTKNFINFDIPNEKFTSIMKTLNDYFSAENILPQFQLEDTQYSHVFFIDKLMVLFVKNISELEKSMIQLTLNNTDKITTAVQEAKSEINLICNRFKKIMVKVISINNTFYYPHSSEKKYNILFYIDKIEDIKNRMERRLALKEGDMNQFFAEKGTFFTDLANQKKQVLADTNNSSDYCLAKCEQ